MSSELSLRQELPGKDQAAVSATIESMIAGQLAPNTRRAYREDAQQLLDWLTARQLSLQTLTKSDMQQYRVFLREKFAKASAARKLVVARKLLEEAVERGIIASNPARKVAGYASDDDPTTPHQALKSSEAFRLLSVIDTTTNQGKRDYAMLMLIVRTGIRRSECAGLCLGDLTQELGHQVALLRQTKGDKRRKIKIPVIVRRAIEDYLIACARHNKPTDAPLFIQFRKGDHPYEQPISGQVVARVVEKYAALAGLKSSPHALRATFVTLALEGGAKLQQVQYAVGHADPRTTERYQQRKLNLDTNAVDFVQIAPD